MVKKHAVQRADGQEPHLYLFAKYEFHYALRSFAAEAKLDCNAA